MEYGVILRKYKKYLFNEAEQNFMTVTSICN